jgi:rhodanese-related sulfurtransferase
MSITFVVFLKLYQLYRTTMKVGFLYLCPWSMIASWWWLVLLLLLLFHWNKADDSYCAHAFVPLLVPVVVQRRQQQPVLMTPANNNKNKLVMSHQWSLAAAPGVDVASENDLRQALQNPATTVVDARSLAELQASDYYRCEGHCRWVHAPASKVDAPLLTIAAASLIPDLDAPVVIYCVLGFRAAASQRVLRAAGYTNVLNAGGFDDIMPFSPAPPP